MSTIDPELRIGAVHLAVSDLPSSLDFYERVLGLPVISADDETASLAVDRTHPVLTLTRLADPTPVPHGSSGLFHVAWLHPSRASLAETVRRVALAGWPIEGASDHGVSEALYLSDPDGLGIEIYSDRPREQWERPDDGRGVRMYTLPLDIEDLLAQSLEAPGPAMVPESGIGHVHMKVADAARANDFYRDVLGFEEQAQIPSAAFLSAGGYHHHVGLNSWQSQRGARSPDSAPGLRRVDFELAGPAALEELAGRLEESQVGAPIERGEAGSILLRDPDGQPLHFSDASSSHAGS
jgi:catechol 2,3-dioxygenase